MNLAGIPYPWPCDGNSAGMGAGQPKSPHGRPVSITSHYDATRGDIPLIMSFLPFLRDKRGFPSHCHFDTTRWDISLITLQHDKRRYPSHCVEFLPF